MISGRMQEEEVEAAREDPSLQVAGEQLPQRPLLPSLPCPYPLEAREVKRGKHAHFDKLPSPIDDPSSLAG